MQPLPHALEALTSDGRPGGLLTQLLATALNESFDSILISEAGPGYPIIYANPAFQELTGYVPDEVIGKSPSILQGPKTDPDVIKRMERRLSNGELFHGRTVNYRKDGSEFAIEWKVAPIEDEQGKITHYVAIQRHAATEE